jgi:hypothetical protein
LKLLNWGHKEPNIGVIYQSKYIPASEDESAYIDCLAAVSKYKYPTYSKEMIERHQNGELFFSMETWFKNVQCSICDEVFLKEDSYCSHLRDRFSEGSMNSRILRGLTFAGAACVENPADVNAASLAIASEKDKEETGQNTKIEEELIVDMFSKEQVDEMVKEAVAVYLTKIEELENKNKELDNTAQASLADVTNLSKERDELKTSFDSLVKEFDELKTSIAAERVARTRMFELASLGFAVPDALANEKEYNELFTKVMAMDNNSFDILKQIILANPKTDVSTTSASVQDVIIDDTNSVTDIPITSSNDAVNNTPLASAQRILENLLNRRS